jgi:hypothetical protein
MKCYTNYKENVLNTDRAESLYYHLKYNIEWEDGIRSKKGYTRKAKPLNFGDIPEVDKAIVDALKQLSNTNYAILGIYLNNYENGEMWTPNHSHKGTHQLVVSLGQTRRLDVGNKHYNMTNGSGIIFGSSIHGVPKDGTTEGRISIATFMVPLN